MQRRFLTFAILVLLAACAVERSATPPGGVSPEDTQSSEARLREANQRIAELETELDRSRSALEAARHEMQGYRNRILDLEAQLDQATLQSESGSEEVEELQRELERARRAEREASRQVEVYSTQTRDLDEDLADLQQNFDTLSRQYERAFRMMSPDAAAPEDVANEALAAEIDAEEPHIQTVHYATNRVRLDRRWTDYAQPFLLPVGLLIAVVVLFAFVRRYIKERYQTRARLLVGLAGGVAVVVTTGLAFQETAQMRQRDTSLVIQYGNELRRPESGEAPYERGYVDVSIPPQRRIGEVARPDLIRFEFVVDPTEHFQLASIQPSTSDEFYSGLQQAIDRDPAKSAFVFVHGFHNTFEDAAFRTAQIAYDMQYQGAPVFFSWPSQGAVLDYLTDAKNVETTVLHLRQFLQELHAESGATRIHLIAHSMGSRALAQAVEDMDGANADTGRFGQLVFAAPDIARDLLEQKVSVLDRVTEGVTLYASAHDSALKLSRALQGQDEQSYQRAGETHPSPMVAPPMQTVDVSRATSGHSYISDSPHMIRELSGLLDGSRVLDEDSENYVPVGDGNGYWLLLDTE